MGVSQVRILDVLRLHSVSNPSLEYRWLKLSLFSDLSICQDQPSGSKDRDRAVFGLFCVTGSSTVLCI